MKNRLFVTLLFAMFNCAMLCASHVQHSAQTVKSALADTVEPTPIDTVEPTPIDTVVPEMVTFDVSDFEGQGVSGGSSDGTSTITASKNGVTFTCNNAFGSSSEIRCYKGANITITSRVQIASVDFTFSSTSYNTGVEQSYTVNAYSWTVSPTAQIRVSQIKVNLNAAAQMPEDSTIVTPVDTVVQEIDPNNYVILTQRSDTAHWFYMTSDLGSGSVKRYQAVDAGTAVLAEVNTGNLEDKYYWQLAGNKLHTAAGYSRWKSGNSAELDASGSELVITHLDDGTYQFMLSSESRYLGLNRTYGNDYFAYYLASGAAINVLYLLKEGDNVIPVDTTTPTPVDTITPSPIDTTTPTPIDTIEPQPIDTTQKVYMTLAELMTLTANTSGLTFGAFDVVYVNGNYTYIKDETGSALIYKNGFGLNVGDHVEAGLEGSLNIYNKLYEIVPTSTVADLTVTSGQAPVIPDATELPSFDNMNRIVVFRGVHFASNTTISSSSKTVTGLWGTDNQSFTLYNRKSLTYSFTANKLYDITAACTVYNTTYQGDILEIAEDTITENPADTIEPVVIEYVQATCADLMNLPDSTYVELGDFDVAYVTGAYTHIQDATGAGLIFMRNYGLQAGAHVEAGLRGQLVIYRGRYEVIPMTAYSELTVTQSSVPTYEDATELPNHQNMNAIRVYRHVYFPEAMTLDSANRTVRGLWGGPDGDTIVLYNRENLFFFFGQGRMYTITGANSVFNGVYQIEVIAGDEEVTEQNPVDTSLIINTCQGLLSVLDPQMMDSMVVGQTSEAVVMYLYVDQQVCNDLVITGTYNGWLDSLRSEMIHMSPLYGCDGWYQALLPYNGEPIRVKVVQLQNDTTFSWGYQNGDTEAWSYVAGNVAEFIEAEYPGESYLQFPSAGPYACRLSYFKNGSNPCSAAYHTYTVTLAAPDCPYEPAIIGDFCNWQQSYPMTRNADGTYTYTWQDIEGNSFKFRAVGYDDWSNEIMIYFEDYGQMLPPGNIILGSDTEIYIDYSAGTYTLGCDTVPGDTITPIPIDTIVPIDTIYIPMTCAGIMRLQDDGNTFVELGAFDVVYVNGRHIYIRDTTGAALIYSSDTLALHAGEHVEAGFRGKFAIYSGLYEIYPISKLEDLTITPGEVPEYAEATAAPSFANMNQVVVYKGVRFGQTVTISNSSRNATGMWGDGYDKINIHNKFGIRYTFENNKEYDLTVANSVYKDQYQVYFISAEEYYEPPVVTVFGQEVVITDPEDSTIVLEEVDVLGDSTLMYNVEENTLTFSGATMTVGDSVSTAISYTGTEPLTIIVCDSSTIFADTVISSAADVYIAGEGLIEMEAVVPIIGAPTAVIVFDSVNMYVRSLPTPAAVRRRIRGVKKLDESGGPALSGFASADFNKTSVTPPDAAYEEVMMEESAGGGESGGGGPRKTMALVTYDADSTASVVTEFTLTAIPDPIDDAVEYTTADQFDPNAPYCVYTMHGLQIGRGINNLPAGVYIIRQDKKQFKWVK